MSRPRHSRGYRSGLEELNAAHLKEHGVDVAYESLVIPYVTPATRHTYRIDFPLPNGILVETKGKFELADRKKHLLVAAQHPHLDIRFIFQNPNARLYKGSPTTYAMWCDRHGFKYATKLIPLAWLKERPRKVILTPDDQLPPVSPRRSTKG